MHNELGMTAGDVYRKLGVEGEMSMSRLKKEVGQNDVMVTMAVGWLAREGKVNLAKQRNGLRIALDGR
jgi:hypothetical protein